MKRKKKKKKKKKYMIVQLIVVHDEVINTHSCTYLDQSGIMFRVLNTKKGSAVWVGVHARMHCFTHCNNDGPPPTSSLPQGLRAQIDRDQYRRNMQESMRRISGLCLHQDSVENLIIGGKEGEGPQHIQVFGVCLGKGRNKNMCLAVDSVALV